MHRDRHLAVGSGQQKVCLVALVTPGSQSFLLRLSPRHHALLVGWLCAFSALSPEPALACYHAGWLKLQKEYQNTDLLSFKPLSSLSFQYCAASSCFGWKTLHGNIAGSTNVLGGKLTFLAHSTVNKGEPLIPALHFPACGDKELPWLTDRVGQGQGRWCPAVRAAFPLSRAASALDQSEAVKGFTRCNWGLWSCVWLSRAHKREYFGGLVSCCYS